MAVSSAAVAAPFVKKMTGAVPHVEAAEKPYMKKYKIDIKTSKRSFKGTSLIGGSGGPPSVVDFADGRIIRSRPFHYDEGRDYESLNPYKIDAHGKTFEPAKKSVYSFIGQAYKKRVYSENRVRYPLKRVDWDPNGERNPQNRGKSRYVRISWDEAAQIVADELLRINKTYGPSAVLSETDLHGEACKVSPTHGCCNPLLSLLGGYTIQMRNYDSWEGWAWGAKNVWGCEPVGEMMPADNLYQDIAEHGDLLLFWGCDPETTPLGINGMMASRLCYWLSEIGLKSIYICPDLNYGAAVHADKWIPVLPNTDAALQLAIAYVWLTEGTYEKEYVRTHAVGYEEFFDYVLGKEDSVPKTPKWASEKCGVPPWTIKALARDWAKKVTSIIHGNGGNYIRGPYSTEPARLEVILLSMRGLGMPGVHQAKMIEWGLFSRYAPLPFQGKIDAGVGGVAMPFAETLRAPNSEPSGRYSAAAEQVPKLVDICRPMETAPQQSIPKCLVHDAILKPSISWWGLYSFFGGPPEQQWTEHRFPEEGCSRIHMVWTDSPCMTTCWNDGYRFVKAMQSPEIEFIVAQHPWLENDCLLADIILPICTLFEFEDITEDPGNGIFPSFYYEHQVCPPVGESVPNFEAVARIAEKLGPEYYTAYTRGSSLEEAIELMFKGSGIADKMSFEEFKKEGIYVIPTDPKIPELPAGLSEFNEDPAGSPLSTPTGLLEFTSTNLKKHFPDDPERPPYPKWIESGVSHDERLSSKRAKKYPLLCVSNHGRWRMHAQCDDITWTREVETMKIRGKDGYQYEPIWLNPVEAEKRGIKHGDIVKIFNERGIVLGGAYVTERLIPNTTYMDHGARFDPIDPNGIDRGGAINLITPTSITSKKATGMVVGGFLVEVEKVTDEEMEAWKKAYPESFARKVHPSTGVCLDGWLIKG